MNDKKSSYVPMIWRYGVAEETLDIPTKIVFPASPLLAANGFITSSHAKNDSLDYENYNEED